MEQPSVITDEMRKWIGGTLGTQTVEVEKGWIKRFAEVIEDSNPLWQEEEYAQKGPYGGIIAPPSFIFGFFLSGRPYSVFRIPFKIPSIHVDGGGEWKFFEPVRPGDIITITTKIADVYERMGKSGMLIFVIHEMTYTNQKNQLVCIFRKTTICL